MSEIVTQLNLRQHLFIKYTFFVLIDLTVLNLFSEFSKNVYISSFSISLAVAILLQVLLQVTLKAEHYIADYFKSKEGIQAKILRGLSTWLILFISKLVILKIIALVFGTHILFHGPIHGVITFIVVVIAIIIAEQMIVRINNTLESKYKEPTLL